MQYIGQKVTKLCVVPAIPATGCIISIPDSFMYTFYRICTYTTFLGIVPSLIVGDILGKVRPMKFLSIVPR